MFAALFDIIRIPFGYIIRWLYALTNSYFVAILLFAVLLKVIMFPFGIKQQKNYQKQAKLRPKENVIRKKYAGRTDRATQLKMNTEIQELYQKENFSPFGGCLPTLIQLLVLLAVYAVVRTPLTYTASLPKAEDFDTVRAVKQTVAYMAYQDDLMVEDPAQRTASNYLGINKTKYTDDDFWKALAEGKYNIYSEINAIHYIRENKEAFIQTFDNQIHFNAAGDEVKVGENLDSAISGQSVYDALPDLDLFSGFDLGTIPSFSLISAPEFGAKLLLIIPVLTLVTSYFGQALAKKYTYQPAESTPEMKSQMRMMNVFMPLFSLYISFQIPASVGIYMMVQNMLAPLQQIALSKIFPIPEITPEEMLEAERLYAGKQKKKKGTSSTGKKKKSLVYDDDDEYESVSTTPEKKVLKEKKNPEGKGIIEKAPLKEEKND